MIEKIKRYLNISSMSLALYLGISLDFLKSIISGRRFLSLELLQELMLMHNALELNTPASELPVTASFATEQEHSLKAKFSRYINLDRIAQKQALISKETLKLKDNLRGLHALHQLLQVISDKEKQEWLHSHKRILISRIQERVEKIVRMNLELEELKAKHQYLEKLSITTMLS